MFNAINVDRGVSRAEAEGEDARIWYKAELSGLATGLSDCKRLAKRFVILCLSRDGIGTLAQKHDIAQMNTDTAADGHGISIGGKTNDHAFCGE